MDSISENLSAFVSRSRVGIPNRVQTQRYKNARANECLALLSNNPKLSLRELAARLKVTRLTFNASLFAASLSSGTKH